MNDDDVVVIDDVPSVQPPTNSTANVPKVKKILMRKTNEQKQEQHVLKSIKQKKEQSDRLNAAKSIQEREKSYADARKRILGEQVKDSTVKEPVEDMSSDDEPPIQVKTDLDTKMAQMQLKNDKHSPKSFQNRNFSQRPRIRNPTPQNMSPPIGNGLLPTPIGYRPMKSNDNQHQSLNRQSYQHRYQNMTHQRQRSPGNQNFQPRPRIQKPRAQGHRTQQVYRQPQQQRLQNFRQTSTPRQHIPRNYPPPTTIAVPPPTALPQPPLPPQYFQQPPNFSQPPPPLPEFANLRMQVTPEIHHRQSEYKVQNMQQAQQPIYNGSGRQRFNGQNQYRHKNNFNQTQPRSNNY